MTTEMKSFPDSEQVQVEMPDTEQAVKEIPDTEQISKDIPDTKQKKKELPDAEQRKKGMPPIGHPENTVIIGNKPIEIRETKVKYARNGSLQFYHVQKTYPLTEVVQITPDQMKDGRDGDKALFDWLVAMTDDVELIKDNYDNIDISTIEKLIEICGRINKIDEKEEKLKNLMAPKKGA